MKLEADQILGLHEYVKYIRERAAVQVRTTSRTDRSIIHQCIGERRYQKRVLSNLLHDLRKANGRIKSLRQLRASVIVDWLKRYNLREVQYMAGHRYVSSTESYGAHDVEALSKDMDVYHPLQN